MKKVLLILAVLAVLVPACYYVTGLRAGADLETHIATLKSLQGLDVALKEKQQGVFESSYRYTLTVDLPRPPQGAAPAFPTPSFDLRVAMAHGPLPFTAGQWTPALAVLDTTLEPGQGAQEAFKKLLDALPELSQTTLRTIYGFSGNSRTTLTVPPINRAVTVGNDKPLDVEWQGLTGVVDVAANAASYTFALDAPLLGLKDKTGAMTLRGLSWTSAMTRSQEELYFGNTAFSLTDLRFEEASGLDKSFVLSNLALTGGDQARGDVVDGEMTIRGEGVGLRTQSKVFFDAAFSLKNVDLKALSAISREFKAMNQNQRLATPEVRAREVQALLQRQGGALLSKGPRLTVEKLLVRVDSGSIETSGFMAYSGTGTLPASSQEVLGQITASFKAQATERALMEILATAAKNNPASLAQAEAAIQNMIAQGFVVRDQGTLSTVADWNGKTLKVNGKALN